MLKTAQELYEEEDSKLAPYAIKNKGSSERFFKESEHPFRLPFQRDRDRILHSRAFKRLQYKTQVFVNSIGDHFRTRLTHTLEVAGVSRSISTALGLNTHLSEVVALAHDLGHSPFGHAGQDILSDLMQSYGGFEHNKQSLRIVQKIENRYPDFPGLNLCKVCLLGLMKHGGEYGTTELKNLRKNIGPSLESLIVDFADEIAYNNHDIDDGLENGFLVQEDLSDVKIWQETYKEVQSNYKNAPQKLLNRKTVRTMIDRMTLDLLETTNEFLEQIDFGKQHDFHSTVSYSKEMKDKVLELKKFLHNRLYNHPRVLEMSERGKKIIEELFKHFLQNIHKIPESYKSRIEEDGKHRVIVDYIAGMTDRYAEQIYNRF